MPVSDQLQLDLLPAVAPARRKLKTSVEASIYCDAPVATPLHRAIAAALDGAMILISAALFLATFHMLGGRFPMNKETALFLGLAVGLLAFFYGAIWALANRPTPGKRWTKLEIVNFDGFAPDPRQRGLRFIGAWLSFCAVGLGLIWALVDEETLTWADHMSQTFPTFKEADNTPFRRL